MCFRMKKKRIKPLFILCFCMIAVFLSCSEKKMKKVEQLILSAINEEGRIQEKIINPFLEVKSIDSLFTTFLESADYQYLNKRMDSYNYLFELEMEVGKRSRDKTIQHKHFDQAHIYVDSALIYSRQIDSLRNTYTPRLKSFVIDAMFLPEKGNESTGYDIEAIVSADWSRIVQLKMEKCHEKP